MAGELLFTNFSALGVAMQAGLKIEASNSTTDLINVTTDLQNLDLGTNAAIFNKLSSSTDAAALSDGSSISNATITNASVSIVPVVNASWQYTFTQLASQVNPAFIEKLNKMGFNKLIKKRNKDICSLFPSFTTEVGNASTSTELAETMIVSAKEQLIDKEVPGPYYLVLPARGYRSLLNQYGTNANLTATNFRDSALIQGQIEEVLGMKIVVLNNALFTTAITGTAYVAAVYSPLAIGSAQYWDYQVRTQEDVSLVGGKAAFTSCYATQIVDASYGVKLTIKSN